MPGRPRSFQSADGLAPNPATSLFCDGEVTVEGGEEQIDGGLAGQHEGVVGLHEEAAPGKIGRAAHDLLHGRAVHGDGLVVLQAAHVLAVDVRPARRGHQASLGFGLGSARAAMALAVVDDDLERAAELLQTVDDFGQIEVVGDDADLGLVGDGLVERLEDRGARLETHPGQRGDAVGVGRGEVEALGGLRRHQRVDRAVLTGSGRRRPATRRSRA